MRRIAIVLVAIVGADGSARAERRQLSLRDALAVTLQHNGDILLARADVGIAATDIALAESAFDHVVVATGRWWQNEQPPSATGFASTDSGLDTALELTGRTTAGTSYSVGVGAVSDGVDNPFSTVYNPAHTTTATVTVTQPLLRGAWRAANRAPIVVAARRRDQTEHQLRVRLEQIVGQVEVAYWGLALARMELDAREASSKLAREQLAESQRLVRLGTISDLDVLEARAGVNRNEQQLIRARQSVADAEGRLYVLMIGSGGDAAADELVPSDAPELVETSYAVDEHVALARRNRPDLAAAHAQLAAEQAGLDATSSAIKPQVDLILRGGLIGFAGDLSANGQMLANSAMFTPDPDHLGGLGRSIGNLAGAKHYTVSLALRVELPLENRAAKSRHDRQRLTVARARTAQQAVRDRVDDEVRTSLSVLRHDEALQRAADDTVATSEKLLVGMRKRFAAGVVTSFDVLRVADELTRAQIEAARARVSYRISLARLATANGTLLQRHQVGISASK